MTWLGSTNIQGEGRRMVKSIGTALLLSSSAWTGVGRTVSNDWHGVAFEVQMNDNMQETTRVQFFDLGIECNLPFPVWDDDKLAKYYISFDAGAYKNKERLATEPERCFETVWKHFEWKITDKPSEIDVPGLGLFKTSKKGEHDRQLEKSKGYEPNGGVDIYELSKGNTKRYVINLPLARPVAWKEDKGKVRNEDSNLRTFKKREEITGVTGLKNSGKGFETMHGLLSLSAYAPTKWGKDHYNRSIELVDKFVEFLKKESFIPHRDH